MSVVYCGDQAHTNDEEQPHADTSMGGGTDRGRSADRYRSSGDGLALSGSRLARRATISSKGHANPTTDVEVRRCDRGFAHCSAGAENVLHAVSMAGSRCTGLSSGNKPARRHNGSVSFKDGQFAFHFLGDSSVRQHPPQLGGGARATSQPSFSAIARQVDRSAAQRITPNRSSLPSPPALHGWHPAASSRRCCRQRCSRNTPSARSAAS
jgi:hypothetical protein